MIDTHCHLDDPRFDPDRDEVISRARHAGVSALVVPGVSSETWPHLPGLARVHGQVRIHYGLGTHPHALPRAVDASTTHEDVSVYLPGSFEGASAVGECGLDGGVPVPMALQERVLLAHLSAASDTGLPLILHCYRAHDRILPLLRRFAPLRGVMHSYSGGAALVPAYVSLGLHLSFGGAITWQGARKPVDALRAVPRDRLLAETDAPDQCPRPHRGRCEPAYLSAVMDAMERLRGEALRDALPDNAASLGWT